ncbi:amino acid ABC transporter permease [Desulfoplanes sp. PS50]
MNDFQFSIITMGWTELKAGALITLNITFVSFLISLAIGIVVGVARSRPGKLRYFLAPYVEFFRGTPLLIQLFFIYYALPATGLTLQNMTAAYVGIGLCGGAYISEIIRAALMAVPREQEEAARSTGLSSLQTLLYVVLPQAVRVAIPPITNAFASQLKETSLVSVLAINELTRSGQMIYSRTFRPFEIYLAVAMIYFAMTFSVALFSRYLEKMFKVRGTIGSI